jgi:hypothetical protein
MSCPFPGMDPYIERPEIWADFHDRFVTFLCGALQPLLRPRYAALMKDRLYVVEADQARYPDVGATAMLDVDTPTIFEIYREEIRQPFIEIVEPALGSRVVTAIEMLSPDNKNPGPGRTSYLAKRDQYEAAGASLVEIDLLRGGQPTVRLKQNELDSLEPWHYLVAVSRWPTLHEIYPIALQRRLPKIAIPLAYGDRDVPADLQAIFARCWEEAAYPDLLHYDQPLPTPLTDEELRWCREQLAKAGFGTMP